MAIVIMDTGERIKYTCGNPWFGFPAEIAGPAGINETDPPGAGLSNNDEQSTEESLMARLNASISNPWIGKGWTIWLLGIVVLIGLCLTTLYSYLLFHTLIELVSIAVAWGVFMIAWNSRRFLDRGYLPLLGVAYLFIGGIDLVHTLAYKGMGVFVGYDADLPTQLWIAARYMESLSLLAALFFVRRRVNMTVAGGVYTVITGLLLAGIFYGGIFPVCYVEGVGLTPFKKISEYTISLILLGAAIGLYRTRADFDRQVYHLLLASVFLTIGAELAFTFYVSVYGLSNLIGHLFKLVSFYLLYKAVIDVGLNRPYSLLLRDLKHQQDALHRSSEQLRAQYRSLPVPTYTWRFRDGQPVLADFNDAAVESTDGNVGDFIGRTAQEVYPDLPDFVQDMLQCQEKREITRREARCAMRMAAEEGVCIFTYVPVSSDLVMVHAEDVTEERLLEAERSRWQQQQAEAEKLEVVAQLSTGIAHDFNNLLTSIIGFAELLELKLAHDGSAQDMVARILDSGRRAAYLVSQLLAYASKQMVAPSEIDLNAALENLGVQLRKDLPQDVSMELSLAPGLWLVRIDHRQVEQMVTGLTAHARDGFAGNGSILVQTDNVRRTDEHVIHFPEMPAGDYVRLTVQDDGPGLDPSAREHIFEPFYFGSERVADGVGLRLAAVYGIVKQNNGHIRVESAVGQGTSFHIYLPRSEDVQSTDG